MKKLGEKWSMFWNIALGPGSAVFTLLTISSLIIAYVFKDNTLFSTLLSILGSFFAGFAGNFIKDDYEKVLGQNILEKKGRSAVRTLESVSRQVKRICSYIKESLESGKKPNNQFLIELNRHVFSIEDYISSSVEDWVDVIPELAKTLEELRKINKLSFEIEELKKREKEHQKNEKDGEKTQNELRKIIEEKEDKLRELRQRRNVVNLGAQFSPSGYGLGGTICENCGNFIDFSSPVLRLDSKKCENCQGPGLYSSVASLKL
ncbi:hypothetical protein COX94_02150 [Candidatus Nomurabacteria bacterium CG_4_10_14_0_2_um_filter_33_9]|uniref:Uncharacterized protein n=1 Tax=Candidatus Nomurabacteria bacterium CG_4_10_14_0_2_um_filter_33_9 TaxID=1974728 RepID=A0A2J0MEW0_9BACT|nr:MAG: hypothetical protein COX94_02150 [Candidatus Nomurabacteria bacterium CG_4_10_14_0_2_um_filter_33_9]